MIDGFIQQLVNGLSIGMGYALVAMGLTLIFGVLHVVNFAHGELYLIGGLAAVLVVGKMGLPYVAALPAAMAAAAACGWLVDRVTVRPLLERRDSAIVMLTTYAASLLILQSVLSAWGTAPFRIEGVVGIVEIGGVVLTYQRMLVVGAGLLLLVGIDALLKKTSYGRELRAVAQDAFGARTIGIEVSKVRSRAYVLSAAVAGAAGALLVPITLFTPYMGQHVIIKAFVVVVVGGMGNVGGAVIFGLGLGVLEALLGRILSPGFASALIYSALIVALLLRPQGLMRGRPA